MAATPQPGGDGGPWYRHFWPWFILALLSTAVVASLTTVWIAFTNRDALVRDDYYEDGTAINRRLELQRRAEHLGVVAVLEFPDRSDARTNGGTNTADEGEPRRGRGDIEVALTGRTVGAIEWLRLELGHPTRAVRDRRVMLSRAADGRFHGRIGETLSGRWYATLEPAPSPPPAPGEAPPGLPWRLVATIQLPARAPITLGRASPEKGVEASARGEEERAHR